MRRRPDLEDSEFSDHDDDDDDARKKRKIDGSDHDFTDERKNNHIQKQLHAAQTTVYEIVSIANMCLAPLMNPTVKPIYKMSFFDPQEGQKILSTMENYSDIIENILYFTERFRTIKSIFDNTVKSKTYHQRL